MSNAKGDLTRWVQRQLRVRMIRADVNAAQICRKLRRPVNWLTRKIYPGASDPRALALEDLEQVCEAMGLSWRELLTQPIPDDEALREDPYA